jgi:hypothetical protein
LGESVLKEMMQWLGKGRRDKVRESMVASARKALDMKRKAGPQTNIPEHRTPGESAVRGPNVPVNDSDIGKEATYQANLKRSRAPRAGDAS